MLYKKLDASKLDDVRDHINNLPKNIKHELIDIGFDINNDQHLRDFAKEINILLQLHGKDPNNELSIGELDSISGGKVDEQAAIKFGHDFAEGSAVSHSHPILGAKMKISAMKDIIKKHRDS